MARVVVLCPDLLFGSKLEGGLRAAGHEAARVEGEEGARAALARGAEALVVDLGAEAVTVAVTPEEARRVAYAAAAGVVTLALTAEVRPAAPAPPGRPAPGTPRTAGTTASAPPSAPATRQPAR